MRIRIGLIAAAALMAANSGAIAQSRPWGYNYSSEGDSGLSAYAGLRGSLAWSNDTTATAGGVALRASYDTGKGGSIYVGTRLPYGFRLEGEALYRDNTLSSLTANGVAQTNLTGHLQIAAPMLNLFYDLPVPDFPFRPFIGAGVGAAYVDAHIATNGASAFAGDSWNFAYQLMAGGSLPLNQSSRLTAMYRWFHSDRAALHCLVVTACHADLGSQSVDLGFEMDL